MDTGRCNKLPTNSRSTRAFLRTGPRGTQNRTSDSDSDVFTNCVLGAAGPFRKATVGVQPSKVPATATTTAFFLIYANSICVPTRQQAFRQIANARFPTVHYGERCDGGVKKNQTKAERYPTRLDFLIGKIIVKFTNSFDSA